MGCKSFKSCATVVPDERCGDKPLQQRQFHAEYAVLERLGKGNYAQVHRVQSLAPDTDDSFAVKIMHLQKEEKENQATETHEARIFDCKREVYFLKQVSKFSSCLQLIESFVEAPFCYIVVEKCDYSLWRYFTQAKELHERRMFRLFRGMLEGIAAVHSLNIVHRDIKPDNYMICKGGFVKLCDFGFAEHVPPGKLIRRSCGTAPYMSPEMLIGKGYNLKTDVWSYFVVVFVLLFGHFPYQPEKKESEAMQQAIFNGTPEPTFRPAESLPCTSETARSFVLSLFSRDPNRRMNAEAAFAEIERCIDAGELFERESVKMTVASARKVGAMGKDRITPETPIDKMLREKQEKLLMNEVEEKLQIRHLQSSGSLLSDSVPEFPAHCDLTPISSNASSQQYQVLRFGDVDLRARAQENPSMRFQNRRDANSADSLAAKQRDAELDQHVRSVFDELKRSERSDCTTTSRSSTAISLRSSTAISLRHAEVPKWGAGATPNVADSAETRARWDEYNKGKSESTTRTTSRSSTMVSKRKVSKGVTEDDVSSEFSDIRRSQDGGRRGRNSPPTSRSSEKGAH